jgi:hypothetical protein
MPGDVRFAKDRLSRNGREMLIVPLTPAEAEERHRNFEPYVVAAKLQSGILTLFHRDGYDRHDPNRPKNWPPGYTPGLRIRLSRPDHSIRVWCPNEWDGKLPQLFHLEVDKGDVRDIWSCYFNHREGERLIYDYRTGEKVYTNSPLTSRERDLTMFPPPEFGQFDDLVGRIFAALQLAGYGEFP